MRHVIAICAISTLLAGCAATVPSMGRRDEIPQQQWVREGQLVTRVKCELQQALKLVLEDQARNSANIRPGYEVDWIRDWGATINLKLIVNERTTFSPSISLTQPLENVIKTFEEGGNVTVARNRSLGIGGSWTSDATRTEQIGFFYTFAELLSQGEAASATSVDDCGPSGGMSSDDDLKIAEFMQSKIFLSQVPDVLERRQGASPFTVFNYQVAFVVTTSANATPGFKLVAVTLSPSGTMFNGQRVRTNELGLTMGPVKKDASGAAVGPSDAVRDAALAEMIGRAVATAIQGQQQ